MLYFDVSRPRFGFVVLFLGAKIRLLIGRRLKKKQPIGSLRSLDAFNVVFFSVLPHIAGFFSRFFQLIRVLCKARILRFSLFFSYFINKFYVVVDCWFGFFEKFSFFLLKSSKETPKVENSKPIRGSFNGPAPDWSPDGPAANHRPLIPSVGVGCVGQCHHRPESAAVQETFDRLRGRHAAGESPSLSLFICFFLAALSVVVFTSFHDFSIALFVRFSWSV